MNAENAIQLNMDITQELVLKNYEKVIDYANEVQQEVIHNWHNKDKKKLEHLILMSRGILNFWMDSIVKKRLWVALVRCGAWIGTLETIEKSVYEESMDLWFQKRLQKKVSSIKHIKEILQILEVKGVMTHSEMVEELHLNYSSTLTEIIKKAASLDLIDIRNVGKYKLYSLTDIGVRYAKEIRTGEKRQDLLKSIVNEYNLQISESSLDNLLQSIDDSFILPIKQGQKLKVRFDNEEFQDARVDNVLKHISYGDQETEYLTLKTQKTIFKEKSANYEMGA